LTPPLQKGFHQSMIGTLLQVAAGGALGAAMRFGVNAAALRLFGVAFPLGTLFVNVVGSALMGVGVALLLEKAVAPRLAPLLMTGLLGGFTTFSAFSLDTVALLERGEAGRALLYVGLSLGLSLLALAGGLTLGRSL
jgi:CrcB protein